MEVVVTEVGKGTVGKGYCKIAAGRGGVLRRFGSGTAGDSVLDFLLVSGPQSDWQGCEPSCLAILVESESTRQPPGLEIVLFSQRNPTCDRSEQALSVISNSCATVIPQDGATYSSIEISLLLSSSSLLELEISCNFFFDNYTMCD